MYIGLQVGAVPMNRDLWVGTVPTYSGLWVGTIPTNSPIHYIRDCLAGLWASGGSQ